MARTIYDKPTRALLKDMLAAWNLAPGEVFPAQRAVDWFAHHYPKLKPGSIQAHLVQASTNDRSRLHHSATNATDDLLFKVGSREYRRFEAGVDPAPLHQASGNASGHGGKRTAVIDEAEDAGVAVDAALAGASQFALEKDLQRYLADNLQLIEPGLALFQDEDITGLEHPVAATAVRATSMRDRPPSRCIDHDEVSSPGLWRRKVRRVRPGCTGPHASRGAR